MSKTLYLELALLGESEQHIQRCKSEVDAAMSLLQSAMDCLTEDYGLHGTTAKMTHEKIKEQLM